MADDVDKRLRYFNGQFLQEQDFNDEQAYHIDRMRRHNKFLHTAGILEGLTVTADQGAAEIEVAPGTAVDEEGKFIVLADVSTTSLEPEHANKTLLLVISYDEQGSNPATVGGEGNTRWHESPKVELLEVKDLTDNHIRLAKLVIDEDSKVSSKDDTVRVQAGAEVGDEITVKRLTLEKSGIAITKCPWLSCGAAERADVKGSLKVHGDLLVDGNVIGSQDPDQTLIVGPKHGGRHLVVNDIPTARWGFATGDYKLAIQNDGSGNWETRMVLTKDGNVGIGTTNPKASLHINGDLFVTGNQNIFKVETFKKVVKNVGKDTPGEWNVEYNGFSEVYTVFAVFQGFSVVTQNEDFNKWYHGSNADCIPQHAFVKVLDFDKTSAQGEAYCSESKSGYEVDNCILLTVVVIGKAK